MLENQERFHSPSSADGSSTLAEGFLFFYFFLTSCGEHAHVLHG